MTEPRTFRILQSLQEALRGINSADGYHTTVAEVAVKLDPNTDVESVIAGETDETRVRPWCLIELVPGTWSYQPAQRVDLRTLAILHYVDEVPDLTDDAAVLKTICRLWADVEQAVASDYSRGGLVTDTRIVEQDFRTFDGGLVWTMTRVQMQVNRGYGLPNA